MEQQQTQESARNQILKLIREGYTYNTEDYDRWVFQKPGSDGNIQTFEYVYKPTVEKNELDEPASFTPRVKQSEKTVLNQPANPPIKKKNLDILSRFVDSKKRVKPNSDELSILGLFQSSDERTKRIIMDNLQKANNKGILERGGNTKKNNRRRRSNCSRKNKKSKRVCKGGRKNTRKLRRVRGGGR